WDRRGSASSGFGSQSPPPIKGTSRGTGIRRSGASTSPSAGSTIPIGGSVSTESHGASGSTRGEIHGSRSDGPKSGPESDIRGSGGDGRRAPSGTDSRGSVGVGGSGTRGGATGAGAGGSGAGGAAGSANGGSGDFGGSGSGARGGSGNGGSGARGSVGSGGSGTRGGSGDFGGSGSGTRGSAGSSGSGGRGSGNRGTGGNRGPGAGNRGPVGGGSGSQEVVQADLYLEEVEQEDLRWIWISRNWNRDLEVDLDLEEVEQEDLECGSTSSSVGSGSRPSDAGTSGGGPASRVESIGSVGSSSGTHAGITGIVDKDISPTGQERQYERPISPEASFRCPQPRGPVPQRPGLQPVLAVQGVQALPPLKCPTGQLFDLASLSCVNPEKAQCSSISPRT
ncbi:chitin-binding type-2 domain-containing protein, partial [Caerostris extrusa]